MPEVAERVPELHFAEESVAIFPGEPLPLAVTESTAAPEETAEGEPEEPETAESQDEPALEEPAAPADQPPAPSGVSVGPPGLVPPRGFGASHPVEVEVEVRAFFFD